MKKALVIIGLVVLVALVAAGSFYGGMTFQTSRDNQASQIRQEFMDARGLSEDQVPGGSQPGGGQFQPGGGMGFGGRGVTGQVKSVEGNVLTLSTAQVVTTVKLLEDTQIEMTVDGIIADLQAGMRVMVTGESDDDGVISASQITILSDDMPAFPMGQGGAYPPPTGTEP